MLFYLLKLTIGAFLHGHKSNTHFRDDGGHVASLSEKMSWYSGKTVLEQLDAFDVEKVPENLPFRMSVQDVYKFTKDGDKRRIVAGTVDTGEVAVGDRVIFYPSGKTSKVQTIEEFNRDPQSVKRAGEHNFLRGRSFR